MSSTTIHGSSRLDLADVAAAQQPIAEWSGRGLVYPMETACRQIQNVCGFPVLHVQAVLNRMEKLSPDRLDAYKRALDAIKRRGLVLMWGDRGVGKTFVATLLGAQWFRSDMYGRYGACRYWTVTDLMDAQKSWFGRKTGEFGPIAEPLLIARDCGLLVLDELNEARDSAFDSDSLVKVIDARYRQARPTVILTNLKPELFVGVLGASVVDRTKDRGAVIKCDWDNYRDRLRSQGGAG